MDSLQQFRFDLHQKAFSDNPDFLGIKKKIGLLMIFIITLRVVFSTIETVYCLSRNVSISACIMNYATIVIGSLFAFAVYKGTKALLYLMMVGGFYSIVMLFVNNNGVVFENLQAGDAFYNFYVFALIAVCFFQIVICLHVLLNKKFNNYFLKMTEINKAVMTQAKTNKR